MIFRRALRLALIGAAVCSAGGSSLAAARVKPQSPTPWTVSPPAFAKKEAAMNYSGFACSIDAPDLCLVVVDEGRQAAFMRREDGKLTATGELVAFPVASKEFDAEGVAVDKNYFYVAGSHSVQRKSCKDHEDNRAVFRIRAGQGTGAHSVERSEKLWAILQELPEISHYARPKACLGTKPPQNAPQLKGENGLNIEGVAERNGRLYFGLRGPAIDGRAYIVDVDAEALFSGGEANPAAHSVAVGAKRAIRDLAVAGGALLALVGPDDDEDEKKDQSRDYSVFLVDNLEPGKSAFAQELAVLDLSGVAGGTALKPEAIAVLSETPSAYRVLILSDKGENGAPLLFDIAK